MIGRLDLQNPNVVFPLALGPRVDVDLEAEAASAQAKKSGRVVQTDKAPTLDLPDALDGRVFLGFDELQRKHLTNSVDMPTVLPRLGDFRGRRPARPRLLDDGLPPCCLASPLSVKALTIQLQPRLRG